MNEILETVQCTNCNLEILCSNYLIHSLHCLKNFYLCSKCQRPVNHNQKVEHNETSHVLVYCGNCNKELEKCTLNEHLEKECAYRKIRCCICDIEIKALEIKEHEDYCGCRTEKCSECDEFVMLKYKTLHIDSNHTFLKVSDEAGPSPSWQNGRRTLCNFMPEFISKQSKAAIQHRKKSHESRRKKSHNSSIDIEREEMDSVEDKSCGLGSIGVYWSKGEKIDETEVNRKSLRHLKDVENLLKSEEDWPLLPSLKSLQISKNNQDSIACEVDKNSKDSVKEANVSPSSAVNLESNDT